MRLIVVLYLVFATSIAWSETHSIKGIVKDSETEEPIPFAHVVIGQVISLTNLDGEFVIDPHSTTEQLVMQISVMGYELSTTEIEDPETFHAVYLKPSTMHLEEVTIVSGNVLMNDVFNRFHLNYEMSSQHMLGYYKENLLDTDSMYYLAEGIVDIYTPSNVTFEQAFVNPIKTRKKVFRDLDDDHVYMSGNASDMAQSSIWRKGSFLNPKNRKNYEFIYAGSSNIGDKDVFIVEFEPKNSKGDTEGKIYIEEETLAVIKLEYHPKLKGNKFWKSVSWVEEYYEKNGMYELFRVSYTGMWEDYMKDYTYNALLVVNESRVTDDLPEDTFLLTEYDSFFHEAEEDFSDSFWDGYNYIKLDVESSDFLKSYGMVTE